MYRKLTKVGVALVLSLMAATSEAALIGYDCRPDDTHPLADFGATWDEQTESYALTTGGRQQDGTSRLVSKFFSDTAEDPTVIIRNGLVNDTGIAWDRNHVTLRMDRRFTLSNPTVYGPTGWQASVVQWPTQNSSGEWIADVDFHGTTPVAVSQVLDFGYTISFAGSLTYGFTQDFFPTPEPSTIVMLATGGLVALGLVLRRRWR